VANGKRENAVAPANAGAQSQRLRHRQAPGPGLRRDDGFPPSVDDAPSAVRRGMNCVILRGHWRRTLSFVLCPALVRPTFPVSRLPPPASRLPSPVSRAPMNERHYFGTDGIRGRVGVHPITAEFALRLGNAAGRVLASGEQCRVLIGKDTRRSGYMLEGALESGLIAAGAEVHLLGPIPTPGVAQLVRATGAAAGIVISASHNPHHDNGVKLFSAQGEKLADEVELAIEAALDAGFETVPAERLGKAFRMNDAGERYLEFCRSTVPAEFSLSGLHLVLDCAHGATYRLAPQLFAALGARVDAIGVSPDGININQACGSTEPQALIARVLATGADLGIAFDGDGDRVLLVDAEGQVLDGDDLLHILARCWQQSGRLRGPVVGTLMTNFALEHALAGHGIDFERANVGDRFVHQRLLQRAGVLGGEASGHLLCLDRAGTGDAMVSALQVLAALAASGRAAATWRRELPRYPQQTLNVRVAPGSQPLRDPAVVALRARVERELAGHGRLVLRASGTEPLIRVTVEAERAEQVQALAEELATAVAAAAATIG